MWYHSYCVLGNYERRDSLDFALQGYNWVENSPLHEHQQKDLHPWSTTQNRL